METKQTTVTLDTPAADATPSPGAAEAGGQTLLPQQWESFPQPAGWSVDWDFEELEKAPRLNGRSGEVTAPRRPMDQTADEA